MEIRDTSDIRIDEIPRAYDLGKLIAKGKVLVLYGPRRVGKTTLLERFLKAAPGKILLESGENVAVRDVLMHRDFDPLLNHITGYDIYAVDEAQRVPDIGMSLKIMVDHRPETAFIATGSSSFDLANKLGEPLVGRQNIYTLYPISLYELYGKFESSHRMEIIRDKFMIYGSYPEVVTAESDKAKEAMVRNMAGSYMLKDIFDLETIKAPSQLSHLIKLLAYQIGQPVSLSELSNETGLNINTVRRYLDLLEKTFVIVRVGSFSNNLRNALRSKSKYYFWDLGMRNAVINNFNPLANRDDIGQLWENLCVIERMKRNSYIRDRYPNYYYYKSYGDKEIDLIEEYNGYSAFEFKWSPSKSAVKMPDWNKKYPDSAIQTVNRDNFTDYLVR